MYLRTMYDDELVCTDLIEMQELDSPEEQNTNGGGDKDIKVNYIKKLVQSISE